MTKAEAILNKYGVQQSGGAAVSPAAPPSPAPSSTGEKSAQILAKYGVEQKKPETTGAGDRLLSILSGAAKNTAASLADASRVQYEGGQGGRSARNEELLEEYTRGLERAKRDMEAMRSMGESEGTIRSQQNVIDDWQRKYDAMAKVVGENVQQKATKYAAELADEVQVSAQKDINTAKKGLGTVGQFAVDVGAAGAQLAGDVLVNTLLPGMGTAFMGYRAFGSGTQEARQSGAELNEQLAYGAGSATLATAAEKIANVAKPFRKAFGGGVLDDAITKAMGKLGQSAAGKLALSALSEGGEEFVEAILQPVLQRATYDPDAKFDLGDALYQAAIGAALGGAGGGVDVIASRKTGTQAQNTPPNPAAQRTAQSEGVDTARSESPAEAPAAPFAQAVSAERTAPAQDTLLASVVKSMQPVTNKQAEALLADAESAVQLGIDTNGMTRSQQRAAVKEKVRQMQLTIPGKEIYKRPDPLTQILFGQEEIAAPAQTGALMDRTVKSDISTPADVETQNSFDAAAQAAYTGIERSAVSQGIADKYGVVLDEVGRGRNKTGRRSAQAQSVIDRAARGEEISLEELNAIPEVAMALEEVHNGVETCTLPNREKIVQDGIRRALERGSYSGKGPDGKDTFNGEVRRNRRIDIVTGVAGSGKSSVYSNRISGEQGSRIIDTDDYRDYIPEYNGRNAALVHEEASAIKKGVLAQALTDGENILLSVVGDNAERLAREILSFRRAGYEVHLHLNHLPNGKSIGRVIARYVNGEGEIGRLVAPELVKKMGDGPMQAYLLITGQGGAEHADTGREQTGSTEDRGDRAAGGGGLPEVAGGLLQQAGAALASYDAYDNDVPFGDPARFLADISRPGVKNEPGAGTVGAAAAGSVNTAYHNLQQDSSRFHSEGANAARPVDVPLYDADGNPISRFASNMMGAKALPDDVIPMIQQMTAEGQLSYRARTNPKTRAQARSTIREKGFDGALEQLRADVRDGKSGVHTVALGTELLVNAANAGDANAVAEIAALMQTTSTNVGQAMQYFSVLRKLNPESQLHAIRKTVEQLNEKLARSSDRKGRGGKKTAPEQDNIPVSEWMTKAGELLAKRLGERANTDGKRVKSVVDTVLDDLTAYARGAMAKAESKTAPRTEEQRLADLMGNLPHYTEAWEAAKARIAQEYGDDPDALAAFDQWMNKDVVSTFLSNQSGREVSVPDALVEKFLQQTDQDGRDTVMEEIYQKVAEQVPPTWKDKWDAWRYMAMLTNPRTHIRNVVGNLGFQPVRMVKNEVGALLERVFGVEEKTKAFASSPAMYRAAWNDYDKVGQLINGNRYSGVRSEIEKRRPIFKIKGLEAVRKGNTNALDFEDAVFKRITYADALAGYLTANGVKAEQMDGGTVAEDLLARARDYAAAEALRATYQDDSAVARKTAEVVQALGPVGEALLPFKRTPANILARGFEYSPAGLIKALTADMVKVKAGEKTVAEALDAVAAGLTGTGLFALGAALFAQGLVTGAKGDEPEDKWEDLLGHQGYAMELPDGTSVTLDWLAPEALPFFMGVEFMSSVGEAGWSAGEIISAAIEATKATANPMMELSMLQGVNDLIESVRYADGVPLEAMVPSVIASYLSQAVPTVLGQAERSGEDVRMTTYTDKDSVIPTDVQYAVGRATAKIPGIDYQQIPYIDAWGREEESGDLLTRVLNNTLNPAYVSKVEMDKVESELQRLYEATKEAVFPRRADKSISVGGETRNLSADEYVAYARAKGKNSYELVRSTIDCAAYKGMSESARADFIGRMYEYANYKAKKSIMPDYESDTFAKYAKAELVGMSPVEYYVMRENIDADHSSDSGQPTQEEAQRYLDEQTELNERQKADMWTIINASWKNNPYK